MESGLSESRKEIDKTYENIKKMNIFPARLAKLCKKIILIRK